MAEMTPSHSTHATSEDPNAAPMHHDVKEGFTRGQILFCLALGLAAAAGGIIAGLVAANS
jgi:hypothetical protein